LIRSVLLVVLLLLPLPSLAAEVGEDGGKGEPSRSVPAKAMGAADQPLDGGAPHSSSPAGETPGERPPDDTTLERYRTPLDVLNERMIGTASRAVRFDWRKTKVGFGIVGSQLLELNNFGSARIGGFVRTPLGSLMFDFAVTRVITWGSESTEKLALTPYRQFGRPSRVELDFNLAYPLVEGVGTARLGFFPATELVFSLNAGLRYIYYPGSLSGANAGEVFKAIFAPRLTNLELDNLETTRPPGMRIDAGRYNLLLGFSLDFHFQTGVFVSTRVMIAPPIFSALSGSGLGWWWELSLAAGWAF
jgi:hypothetical protein